MKSIVYNQYGNVDVLHIEENTVGKPAKNEVLIAVRAASINPLDWKLRNGELKFMSGKKFPKYVGCDFSGVVEKTGERVTSFKPGDNVMGAVNPLKDGSMKENIVVKHDAIVPLPEKISFEQAAGMPTAGAAAYKALRDVAGLKKGQQILLNGCTGGVGMFATQIAAHMGADITGVCGTENIELAEKWGCNTVIDYKKENILEKGVLFDVVFDLSGYLPYESAKLIMEPRSVYVTPTPFPKVIISSFITNIFTSRKHKFLISKPNPKNMNFLIGLIYKGLDVKVSHIFKFEDFKEAYALSEKGGFSGKIVISFS